MRRKDFIISLSLHLLLAIVIVLINPISAMFRDRPDIIIVKTIDMSGGAPAGGRSTPEPENIAPPPSAKPAQDQEIDDVPKLKSEDKKEVVKKEEPKKKKKPDPKPKEPVEEQQKQEEESKPEPEKVADTNQGKSNQPAVVQDGAGGLDVKGAAVGTGVGAGTGNSNLPYNLGMVLSVIERNWRNPVSTPEQIYCTIYFQIDRYGYLVGDPLIETSSGNNVFDQSCVLAIKRAGQFPAFPANFNYNHVGLHLDFRYAPGT